MNYATSDNSAYLASAYASAQILLRRTSDTLRTLYAIGRNALKGFELLMYKHANGQEENIRRTQEESKEC